MAKIGIVGVGNIGGALAHTLLCEPYTQLYLYDIKTSMAKGKAKDLRQAAVISGHGHTSVCAVNALYELKDCDVIVVIAGLPRQSGVDRKALLCANADIVRSVGKELQGTRAVIVMVTNPVDTMTTLMTRLLDLPFGRVVGMASILDEGRFCSAIAKILTIDAAGITGCVVGAHNDSMVPLLSSIRWGGMPLSLDQVDRLIIGGVIEQTRRGGSNIVQLLGNGSAYYGPAEAIKRMVLAITRNEDRLLRCSVLLQGEYGGIHGVSCGTPVVLGCNGVKEIIEYPFLPDEAVLFKSSIETLRAEHDLLEAYLKISPLDPSDPMGPTP